MQQHDALFGVDREAVAGSLPDEMWLPAPQQRFLLQELHHFREVQGRPLAHRCSCHRCYPTLSWQTNELYHLAQLPHTTRQ